VKVILLFVLVLIFGTSFYFYNNAPQGKVAQEIQEEEVNYRASFIIFTNGAVRDFSEPKYHNQSEDVYITSENPTEVIVKRKGAKWQDFFKTLPSPMKVSKDCLTTGNGQVFCTNENNSLKFFLNGERDDDLLSKEIKNGDKALISYGSESEEQVQMQLKLLE